MGGVATGNINAKLEAKTSGIAIDIGATEIATAIDVAIGKNVDVVAVFDVSSVRNTIKVVIKSIITQGLNSISKLNDVPSHCPKPELLIELAKERPPPNKSKSPQGSFFVSSHSKRLLFLLSDGKINKIIATKMAIPASVSTNFLRLYLSQHHY